MTLLIKNAQVVSPKDNLNKVTDILIENGKISKIDKNIKGNFDQVINVIGKFVFPGFVDMHCHLREPGFEYKEDLLSGAKSAIAGGFTSVACMPNLNPVCDHKTVVRYIKDRAKEINLANIYPIGAITKGQMGEELANIGGLKDAGVVAVSDDGKPVPNSLIMQSALNYSKMFDMPVISHCEDLKLLDDGQMNEGYNATLLGLKGISNSVEEVIVARDVILASNTNASVHIAHVSTKGSVEIIRNAKKMGVKVTCETCPHYFSLTDDAVLGFNTNAKMNPPLRSNEDVLAIIEGIKDGTIDAIATDHAPHSIDEKNVEFNLALNGIVGFETAFQVSYTTLVKAGHIKLEKLIELLSFNPAAILKIDKGRLEIGKDADITICDIEKEVQVDKNKFYSKGRNTPFDGMKFFGSIEYVIARGALKFEKGMVKE